MGFKHTCLGVAGGQAHAAMPLPWACHGWERQGASHLLTIRAELDVSRNPALNAFSSLDLSLTLTLAWTLGLLMPTLTLPLTSCSFEPKPLAPIPTLILTLTLTQNLTLALTMSLTLIPTLTPTLTLMLNLTLNFMLTLTLNLMLNPDINPDPNAACNVNLHPNSRLQQSPEVPL